MDYVLADKEIVGGTLGGTFYGSSVRLLVRTPTKLVFTGCGGVRGYERRQHLSDFNNLSHFRQRARIYRVDRGGQGRHRFFPRRWGARTSSSSRGRTRRQRSSTAGGTALSPPAHILRTRYTEKRSAESCDVEVDLTGQIATCLQCGCNLRPHTTHHHMGYEMQPDHPRSIEDCQRLSNHRVIRVHAYRDEERFTCVDWFEAWDGETTQQDTFCSDKCAATYGRRAAQELDRLPVGGEPIAKKWPGHQRVAHYDVEEAEAKSHEDIVKGVRADRTYLGWRFLRPTAAERVQQHGQLAPDIEGRKTGGPWPF